MSNRRFAAILVSAVTAGALWSSVAAADDSKKKPDDPNRRVCKMVIPTGSRMGERVCRSAEEWQRDSDRSQREYQESHDAMRDSIGAPNPNQPR